jgi:hypothetical protein
MENLALRCSMPGRSDGRIYPHAIANFGLTARIASNFARAGTI